MTPEELLKEVGEPVYFEWRHCDTCNDPNGIWSKWKKVEPRNAYVNTVEDSVAEFDAYIAQGYKYELRKLFTSDKVAAAILKATKSLEDQLAAAQEEIKTVTEQKNRMWFEMQTAQDQLAKAEQRVAEYNELIYAVQTKHHDETRHQTALRYIRNAENRPSNTAAMAQVREGGVR